MKLLLGVFHFPSFLVPGTANANYCIKQVRNDVHSKGKIAWLYFIRTCYHEVVLIVDLDYIFCGTSLHLTTDFTLWVMMLRWRPSVSKISVNPKFARVFLLWFWVRCNVTKAESFNLSPVNWGTFLQLLSTKLQHSFYMIGAHCCVKWEFQQKFKGKKPTHWRKWPVTFPCRIKSLYRMGVWNSESGNSSTNIPIMRCPLCSKPIYTCSSSTKFTNSWYNLVVHVHIQGSLV